MSESTSGSLFREAAIAQQGERLWGDLIVSQPLPTRIITALLAAMTLVALLWLAFNSYQRKVTVAGQLMPEGGLLEVPSPATGIVAEVLVKLDQPVIAGTPLFVVELDHTLHSALPLSTGLLQSLQQQQAALVRQIGLENRNLRLVEQRFAEGMQLAKAAVAQWQQVQGEQQELLEIRARQSERGRHLQQQGLLAIADQEALQVQLLLQQQSAGQARMDLNQAQAAEAQLRQDHATAMLRSEQQLQRLEGELLQLEQQQLREVAGQRTVVTAPLAGRVTNLHLEAGMAARQQQPVMAIVPTGSVLQVELAVPSQAIGFVQPGQSVTLRFDAFPYQKFGTQQATISSISGSTDAALSPAGEGSQPHFRITANLAKQTVTAYGTEQLLRPGMRLTADVSVDKRSLLEWLLEPLYSLKGH
ncbi:MAG: HlyD family efflux transporter periplasmic adaptor subunit [Pseudomonadota bacterium]